MGRRLGDQVGHDPVLERHTDAGGRPDDGLVELGGRERRQHVRSGADVLADPSVLERAIEQVGAHGGNEPDVDRSVVDRPGDDLEEAVAPFGRRARPALLELVDDHDRRPDGAGHAGESGAEVAGVAGVRHRGHLCEGCVQCPERVLSGDHADDHGAPLTQAWDETGVHDRALPRPGRSDDGDQPPRFDEIDERVDGAVATVEGRGVGLVERSQPAVRVDACRRRARELAGRGAAHGVRGATFVGGDRGRLSGRSPGGGPPPEHELCGRGVCAGGRPLQHGIETVRDRRHPPHEARDPVHPGTGGDRGARAFGGHRRAGEQLPQHQREVPDVDRLDRFAGEPIVTDERDPEVGEVGGTVVVEQDVRRLHVVVDDAGGVSRHERATDLLDEPRDPRERPRPPAEHRVAGRAAGEQAEHEVGRTGLAPVVVERDDVRVLQPGDEPRLGLEAHDELRRIGQILADRLDRHPSVGAGLGGHVHPPVRPLADRVVDRVPPQRPADGCRRHVRARRDRRLDARQLGRRVETRLVGETHTKRVTDPQRLDPSPGRVEGLHQQRDRPFVERTLRREPLEVGDRPIVMAQRHPGLGPAHVSRVATLLET